MFTACSLNRDELRSLGVQHKVKSRYYPPRSGLLCIRAMAKTDSQDFQASINRWVQTISSPWQKSSRHSTVPASQRTALRLGHILPVCSLIAPGLAGAGTASVLARLSPRTVSAQRDATIFCAVYSVCHQCVFIVHTPVILNTDPKNTRPTWIPRTIRLISPIGIAADEIPVLVVDEQIEIGVAVTENSDARRFTTAKSDSPSIR